MAFNMQVSQELLLCSGWVEQKYAETLSKMMGNLSPPGEGRGEGTALHVESCRGRHTSVNSTSGSQEALPSPPDPSPERERGDRSKTCVHQITNGHLVPPSIRLMPMPDGRVP